jgi:hypothetical protein
MDRRSPPRFPEVATDKRYLLSEHYVITRINLDRGRSSISHENYQRGAGPMGSVIFSQRLEWLKFNIARQPVSSFIAPSAL